jgi:HD-GYP domain-containing protein (c-di-GMP phosphodiesterase class II)
MDISPFKDFFSSLSHISHLNFEIWNRQGFLFSSNGEGMETPDKEEIQDLSIQVMDNRKFLQRTIGDRCVICGIPIKNNDGSIGSLIAYDPESRPSLSLPVDTGETEKFLIHLAKLVEDKWASQKEAEEMAEEIDQRFEELYLYSKIATQLKTLKFSGSMQRDLIEDILGIMRVDLTFVQLPNHQEYSIMASKENFGERVSNPGDFINRLLESIPRDIPYSNDYFYIVNNSKNTPGFDILHPDPYRFLAVKMQHKNELYGWLGMVSFNLKEIFRQSELSLLVTMAEQMGVVIANTNLYKDLERFVINVVKSLVYVIEAKDEYTRGHSERVNRYCMMMADRLEMDEEDIKDLHWASILHDIGKIGIPEAILNKPDRLDNDEFNTIKSHPMKGYEILQPIEQLRSSLKGIMHHHERFDGKGYPKGLKGENIPLIGRIIAVADTFDAITSNRAYRSAKKYHEAMAIMEQVSGSQLDPWLVKLFKDMLNEGLFFDKEENLAK